MEIYTNLAEKLLLSEPSKVIRIDSDNHRKRYEQLEFLSDFEKQALSEVIYFDICNGYELNWHDLPHDPLYYMSPSYDPTVDKDDVEIRCHSDDWSLIIFNDNDGNKIFDFNGWPGDNQNGVIWLIISDQKVIKLFRNIDTHLYLYDKEYQYGNINEIISDNIQNIIKIYKKRRNRLIFPDDHDDCSGCSDCDENESN